MKTKLQYDPDAWPVRVNNLVMLWAEKWGCKPSEAFIRLLDEFAEEQLKGQKREKREKVGGAK